MNPQAPVTEVGGPFPRLFTCCYADFAPGWGIPVRTSVGPPREWAGPTLVWLRSLTPLGIFGVIRDRTHFEAAYLARLQKAGAAKLQRQFANVSRARAGRALVLMCHEKDAGDCHRRLFAMWWQESTGQEVPEITLQPQLFP